MFHFPIIQFCPLSEDDLDATLAVDHAVLDNTQAQDSALAGVHHGDETPDAVHAEF